MSGDKERQEISVVGRLMSLEALVLLMGLVCLVYGLVAGRPWQVLFGAAAVVAAGLLVKCCRRARNKINRP